MTFRDAYTADMNTISIEQQAIDSILSKMRAEVANPTPWIKRVPSSRLAMATAGVCILIAAAVILPVTLRENMSMNDGASDLGSMLTADNADSGGALNSTEQNVDGGAGTMYDFFGVGEAEEEAIMPAAGAEEGRNESYGSEKMMLDEADDIPGMVNEAAEADDMAQDVIEVNHDDMASNEPVDWSDFLSFANYTDWPSADIWNSIEYEDINIEFNFNTDSFPAAENVYDEADEVEQEPLLPPFGIFVKLAETFLANEHSLDSVTYAFHETPQNTAQPGITGVRNYSLQNINTLPLYSMLAKYLGAPESSLEWREALTAYSGYGISFNIYTENRNIFFFVAPTDELVIMVAGYDGYFSLKMDEGEHNKLYCWFEANW